MQLLKICEIGEYVENQKEGLSFTDGHAIVYSDKDPATDGKDG